LDEPQKLRANETNQTQKVMCMVGLIKNEHKSIGIKSRLTDDMGWEEK
jgi:hypothetical protein